MSEIQIAITDLKFTEINYKKANDTNISFRKIEPYTMYSVGHKWILIAWCHLRNEFRAFRIDRIQHFKILNETYEDRGFNLQDYFQNCPWEGAHAFSEKNRFES
ncbi:WYL domain-containing protein [bacterium]|nr:WYL domain-containing protein [bacterium]